MLEFGKIVYGNYKISSMPFDSKDDAWDDIRKYWKGCDDVTTYFSNKEKKWYIISK